MSRKQIKINPEDFAVMIVGWMIDMLSEKQKSDDDYRNTMTAT